MSELGRIKNDNYDLRNNMHDELGLPVYYSMSSENDSDNVIEVAVMIPPFRELEKVTEVSNEECGSSVFSQVDSPRNGVG